MGYTLEQLTGLARALIEADIAAAIAEAAAKQAADYARTLREETLPNILLELQIDKVTLTTGNTLALKQDVYASITEAHKEEAFTWLAEHGLDGAIKTRVITSWGKGETKKALAFFTSLQKRKKPLDVEFEQNVHAQTLRALLREQIAIGTNIPMVTFGARAVFLAKISE